MTDHIILFLIGMPAAGKTYWGEKAAKKYGLQFVDLDTVVVEQEQASMSALFAQYGEQGFRDREHKTLKKVISGATRNTIVACGGGTPCFNDNMKLMKSVGTVIYLDIDINTLLIHLNDSDEIRPMLNNRGDLSAYLKTLLQQRKKFYEQAQHILQSKDISIATFGKIISSCINKQ